MNESSTAVEWTRLAAASMDGVGVLDGDEYGYANDALADVHGYEAPRALVGRAWGELYSPVSGDLTADEVLARARETGAWRGEAVCWGRDGDRVPVELSLEATGDGVVCVVRDVTGREERERELDRYETILDTVDDGVYVLDADLRIEMANERMFELLEQFGFSREEAREAHAHDLVVDDDERAALEASIEQAIESEPHTGSFEMSAETPGGDRIVCESRFRLYPDPEGEHRGCIGVLRDITDREERERKLREARRFNEELVKNAPFGMFRLDEDLRITYENPRAEEIIGLPDDEETSAAVGVDIRELPSIVDTGRADLFSRLQEGDTIEFEFPFESIYGRVAYFSGRGVPLYRDGEFAGAVLMANDISERRQHERDLERQRDELDTLNRINELLLAVARDLFESPMRGDIEQTVCDRLADSDLYKFAWVGRPDVGGNRLVADASAGVADEYVDEVTVTVDDDETGRGPGGRAFRTGEVQVSQNVETDPTFEPWRETALEHELRSAAAVPLTYDGTTYGVLAVYASRPLAFSRRERRGFEILGEAVGYAINATRTRQLLFAERVVELELRVTDPNEFVVGASDRLGCRLSLEGYVSTGEGRWLLYLSPSSPAADGFVELAREAPAVETVRTLGEGEERVVALTARSPLLDAVAALGGRVTAGRVDDGEGDFVVDVPQSTDIKEFVDRLRSTIPETSLLAKREGERRTEEPARLAGDGPLDLTDRQRQALEAAYRAGYFEWPRENSAEDVAALLGVARPTLQAHLRKAEKELLSAFFAGGHRRD